jgi:hypothetical protein
MRSTSEAFITASESGLLVFTYKSSVRHSLAHGGMIVNRE